MAFLKLPTLPGVYKDDTPLSVGEAGFFVESNGVRFERDRPQVREGYELASSTTFNGVCRGLHPWANNNGETYCSLGTHLDHYAFYGGNAVIYKNTPITSRATLTNALTTASGSNTITVTYASHGLIDNQSIQLANVATVGGIVPDGDYAVDVTATNTFLIINSSTATAATTGGGSFDVSVYLAPGQKDGTGSLGYGTGAWDTGAYGTQSDVDYFARTWSESNWGQNSLSSPREGGIYEWAPILEATELVTTGDFATTTGWTSGTGWLISGGVATASAGSASDLETTITMNTSAYFLLEFDMTASAGTLTVAIGSTTIVTAQTASARVKQTFFTGVGNLKFSKSTTFAGTVDNVSVKQLTTAEILPNAPTRNTTMLVTPEKIVMVGGSIDPSTSEFDPMLCRWSDQGIQVDNGLPGSQDWTPTTSNQAGTYRLGVGSRILAMKNGRGEVLAWTDAALYSARYVRDPNIVYSWRLIATQCGVMGPNAPVVSSGIAYWMTPDGDFKMYGGGGVTDLNSTLNRDMFDNFADVQDEKVFGFITSQYSEVGWLYPDKRDGVECSRFVDYKTNTQMSVWTPNEIDRTAWVDAGIWRFQLAASSDGLLYFMTKGHTANGANLNWRLRRGTFDLGEGTNLMQANNYIPDFDGQLGNISLTVGTYEYPGANRVPSDAFTVDNTTDKVDLAPLTGRQMDIEYTGSTAPSFARFGADVLDIQDTGMGW